MEQWDSRFLLSPPNNGLSYRIHRQKTGHQHVTLIHVSILSYLSFEELKWKQNQLFTFDCGSELICYFWQTTKLLNIKVHLSSQLFLLLLHSSLLWRLSMREWTTLGSVSQYIKVYTVWLKVAWNWKLQALWPSSPTTCMTQPRAGTLMVNCQHKIGPLATLNI